MAEPVDDVCRKFCPVFRMHPDESYFPCSLPDLMRNSRFEYYGQDTSTLQPLDIVRGSTKPPRDTPIYVVEQAFMAAADTKEKLLVILGDRFTGTRYVSNPKRVLYIQTKNIPDSVEVQAIFSDPFIHMKKCYFTVTYLLFFPYNGTLEPHVFDQEYATFLISCTGYKFVNDTLMVAGASVARVYLSSHGTGMWYDYDEIARTPYGRPILYCALEGHGLYPKAMTVRRFFDIANDEMSDKGMTYDPLQNIVILAHPTSSLITRYYRENKLYYFNGLYDTQQSNIFRENRSNFLFYDGFYKLSNAADLWNLEPLKTFRPYVDLAFMCLILIIFIVLGMNFIQGGICQLISVLSLSFIVGLSTFLGFWVYMI